MKITELLDLEVHEASLVDAGANQHAKVTFFKRRTSTGGSAMPTIEEALAGLTEEQRGVVKAALAAKDSELEDAKADFAKAQGETNARITKLTELVGQVRTQTAPPPPKPEPVQKEDGSIDAEALRKQLRAELEADIAKAREADRSEIETLKKQLGEERATLRKARFTKRAKDEFGALGESSEVVGEVLLKAHDGMDTDGFEALCKLLGAAQEAVAKSNALLFEERGSGATPDENSAEAKAATIAKRLQAEAVAKGETLTYADAEMKAWETPGLWEQHRRERHQAASQAQ